MKACRITLAFLSCFSLLVPAALFAQTPADANLLANGVFQKN